jgi:hypothetical protein
MHLMMRGFLAAAAVVFVVGCAGDEPRPVLAPVVQQLDGVKCPEERIRVLETREVSGGWVYRVDACGVVTEVERGPALPQRRSEMVETSSEPFELPERVVSGVPSDEVEAVREKILRWCILGMPNAGDADAIAFYSGTTAELEHCHETLAATLEPLGTEYDPDTGETLRWYRLGQYVFTTQDALYRPECEKRSSTPNGASSDCVPSSGSVTFVPVRGQWGGTSNRSRPVKHRFAGRLELGLGYLVQLNESDAISWNTRVQAGIKLDPDMALGLVVATHMGLGGGFEATPNLLDAGLGWTAYPWSSEGIHLDADVGFAGVRYGFRGPWSAGPILGVGIGYDGGKRGQSTNADSWTGPTLSLRGFYTPIDSSPFAGAHASLGVYFW